MKVSNDIIFGVHAVVEAINSGKEIEKIYIQRDIKASGLTALRKAIKLHEITYTHVPSSKISRYTQQNHQGVLAFVSPISTAKIENVIPTIYETGKTPLILILDRITDVRNFGAIARTAECMGVDAIVIPKKESAQINPDAIKTSSGALNRITVCKTNNLKESVLFLKESGIQIIGCTEKTDVLLHTKEYTLPTAIILGSEENGISTNLLNLCDSTVKIPMAGAIASFNVSVATGIILYEVVGQRRG